MNKLVMAFLVALAFASGCVQDDMPMADDGVMERAGEPGKAVPEEPAMPKDIERPSPVAPPGAGNGFCGVSTNAPCESDDGCKRGGCSAHVCQSASENPVVTICDYRECYDAGKYGLSCLCKDSKCQWA